MAEPTQKPIEREYTIPLRRFWINVPEYKRSRKAIMAIKQFVARHMKVQHRDLDKVKIDVYLNNEVWFQGRASPPSKVKVKVIQDGENVLVKFAETPQHVKFLKIKHSKLHKKTEEVRAEKKEEAKSEEKTEEQKKDEKEKEIAGEQASIKQADQQVKAQKHTTKAKEQPIHRMALKK
jgi:ribosomal protein L31E